MKTLLLMRHAEAAAPGKGEGDKGRRLTAEGLGAAGSMGRYLDAAGHLPDLALVSDSRRTRETLDGLGAALRLQPQAAFSQEIYQADGDGLLDHVRAHGAEAHCLLVIGHNPAIGDLAMLLARGTASPAAAGLARGFPPGAVAVFAVDCASWEELSPGVASLTDFSAPAALF